MWVSKVTLPQPDIDVRDAVLRAIEDLKTGDETYDIPAPAAVEAEWTLDTHMGPLTPGSRRPCFWVLPSGAFVPMNERIMPLILKTIILHAIQMSPVKGKQDMRTEFTVSIIRSFMGTKAPLGKTQKQGLRDPGVKGPMWVSVRMSCFPLTGDI
jgi:hypothetical protein